MKRKIGKPIVIYLCKLAPDKPIGQSCRVALQSKNIINYFMYHESRILLYSLFIQILKNIIYMFWLLIQSITINFNIKI